MVCPWVVCGSKGGLGQRASRAVHGIGAWVVHGSVHGAGWVGGGVAYFKQHFRPFSNLFYIFFPTYFFPSIGPILEEPWSFVPIYNNMYIEVTRLCTCTYINCTLPIHTFQDRFSMPLAGSIATQFYIPVKQNQTEIWFIPDFRDHPCFQLILNRCSLFSWPGTKIFFYERLFWGF